MVKADKCITYLTVLVLTPFHYRDGVSITEGKGCAKPNQISIYLFMCFMFVYLKRCAVCTSKARIKLKVV
jgi:hypothetical protein